MKITKRVALIMLIFTASVFSLSGCSSSNSSSIETTDNSEDSSESIVLRYGHTDTEDSITGSQAQIFADNVYEMTEGRVSIEIYPLGQLGTSAELLSSVQVGTVDITYLTMGMLGSVCEEFSALDTPYIYNSVEECITICDPESQTMQYLIEKLHDETGLEYLYSFYYGTREMTSNTPVYTPDDLQGKTYRALAFEIYTSYIDSLGAIATQIDITELAQALQSGSVDGQENPVDVIKTRQLYEYQDYLIMTDHMICAQGCVINGDTWATISEKDQQLILEAGAKTGAVISQKAIDSQEETTDYLVEQGMTIIDESNGLDKESFVNQVSNYFNEKYGEKFATVYSLIEKDKSEE